MLVLQGNRGRTLLLATVLAASCIGDVEVPPNPPTLSPLASPTRRARLPIGGTKPKNTAVLNHGTEVVALDDRESFSFELALAAGDNAIDLQTRRASGKESVDHARATVTFEPDFPAQPSLEPVPTPTRLRAQPLRGTRPAGTSLVLSRLDAAGAVVGSSELVAAGPSTAWQADLQLDDADQVFFFSLVAKDGRGKTSEPVDFQVELDRAPPAIASRYPADNETAVPTNTVVSVGMDGPLAVAVGQVDQDIVVLRDPGGVRMTGQLAYNPLSASLVLIAAGLTPSTRYTVTLDGTKFSDAAGNSASPAPASWVWSFTTGAAAETVAPAAPTLDAPPATTSAKKVDLTGTRPANTAVVINGLEVVPIGAAAAWKFAWPLAVGANALSVVAGSRTGVASPAATASIQRVPLRPSAPVLDAPAPASVETSVLVLSGSKDANTSIVFNGLVVVPRSPETTWLYNADLSPGPNDIELRARAADGTLSDPVAFTVDFTQGYSGPVEAGFKLTISFSLRDLSAVDPIRGTFETGPNRYSVDAWVEGPLQPGETCVFDSATKERKGIRYVGTIVHYIGNKAGHTNPFWDADYRAPDFLAALVSGGVFEPTFSASADRRDAAGAQGGDLVDGTGKLKIGNAELAKIDGITEATSGAGAKSLEWLPLDRNFQRIAQGEYLVHLVVNLDRDPTWVAGSDTEVCWGDEAGFARGPHRLVRRLSLGPTPFSVRIGQTSEASAPDVEWGADQLRYFSSEGVTFRWDKGG